MKINLTKEQKKLSKLINKLEQTTGKTELLSILMAVQSLSIDNDTNELYKFLKSNYSYCIE